MMTWVSHVSIVELDEQGLSARQIAERLGVCTRTVQRVRVETGRTKGPGGGPRYSPEFLSTVEKLLDEGWSIFEIARTHGVSYANLARRFKGRGWPPEQVREYGTWVRKMLAQGVSV